MAVDGTSLKESPSQTAGPYVHIGCTPNVGGVERLYAADLGSVMLTPETIGDRVFIEGRVFDGAGEPLKDALIEIWQADQKGSYADNPAQMFTGWGRQACDLDTGVFRFETVKPGAVPFLDGRMQAPHISFWIVARGINIGLNTRMYFPEEDTNAVCPVLSAVDPERRKTLIANRNSDGYMFDIHLQGENETVFFDI